MSTFDERGLTGVRGRDGVVDDVPDRGVAVSTSASLTIVELCERHVDVVADLGRLVAVDAGLVEDRAGLDVGLDDGVDGGADDGLAAEQPSTGMVTACRRPLQVQSVEPVDELVGDVDVGQRGLAGVRGGDGVVDLVADRGVVVASSLLDDLELRERRLDVVADLGRLVAVGAGLVEDRAGLDVGRDDGVAGGADDGLARLELGRPTRVGLGRPSCRGRPSGCR